jgi:Virulence protein RhuM family
MSDIVVYSNGELELKVSIRDESTWLTQDNIAELFGVQRPAITKHLKNIFIEHELSEDVVSSILEHTTKHGALDGQTQKQMVKYYNLDAIISVGYRVNSKKATSFRQWATSVLKNYIQHGFSINTEKITTERFLILEDDVRQIKSKIDTSILVPNQGIFFDGQFFDALEFASNIIRSANKSIILIDNYIDDSVLGLLGKRKDGVVAKILTKSISPQLARDLSTYNAQYPGIEVDVFTNYHDRFLVIDNATVYHIGASLKDLGKKVFAFSKMDKNILNLIQE